MPKKKPMSQAASTEKTLRIQVPSLGESITEATLANWLKHPGDAVNADDTLAELETDKITLEVVAPEAGVLTSIAKPAGSVVKVGEELAVLAVGGSKAHPTSPATQQNEESGATLPVSKENPPEQAPPVMSQSMADQGKSLRQPKESYFQRLDQKNEAPSLSHAVWAPPSVFEKHESVKGHQANDLPLKERVPMSRLRKRIAQQMKRAQNEAAILTTFNEVDMSAVMALRKRYQEQFEKTHQVRLGFMSFFVRAVTSALHSYPIIGAQIEADDIIFQQSAHVGVAVSTEKGLVVPVVRDADKRSLAGIEKAIQELAEKARTNKLLPQDLANGIFTISNGGVFGSMLSTPILNPPQSAILGLHAIQKRPVAVGETIALRPMMYLALSYDHRLIDGSDAVSFLKHIKDTLEAPERFLLEL